MSETNPIFQTVKHSRTTDRYSFISTLDIRNKLESKGFQLSQSIVTRSRKPEFQGFQKHMLRFRHESLTTVSGLTKGDLIPELVVINDHLGRSSLKMYLGLFRVVCSNGLIVMTDTFENSRVIHNDKWLAKTDDAIERLQVAATGLIDRVNMLKGIQLTDEQKQAFIKQAYDYRLANVSRIQHVNYDAVPVRQEDVSSDLFTVMNVIQEKVIRGGITGTHVVTRNGTDNVVDFRTRGIRSIDQSADLNATLWRMAEKQAA